MKINDLQVLTVECAEKINELLGQEAINLDNIKSVEYNSRLKNALGRAIKNRYLGTFNIEFSKAYFTFEGTSLEEKTSVVYHELVHTIQGCFNHSNTFNNVCRRIERHTGIKDIAGAKKKSTNGYRKSNSKYQIACTKCGVVGFRHKTMIRGAQVGIVPRYSCRCGGTLEQTLNN